MNNHNAYIKGVFYIVLASILWGTTGTASAFIPDVSPLAVGAFAMGVGGVLLVLTSIKQLYQDKSKLMANPKLLLIGGLSVALYPLAFYSSMRLAGVTIGTVISIASAPFFTVLMERFISHKKITLKWILSFIFGAVGVVLLTMGKTSHVAIDANANAKLMGIVLGLVAGLTYATYSWSAKQMIESGVNSRSAMASIFGISAILLLPSLLLTGDNLFMDIKHVSIALYMAIAPMFLGYLLFGQALRVVEASKATLITLLEPMVATLFAIVLLGEVFSFIGWVGMLLMMLCFMLQVIKIPKFIDYGNVKFDKPSL